MTQFLEMKKIDGLNHCFTDILSRLGVRKCKWERILCLQKEDILMKYASKIAFRVVFFAIRPF
jgi:hypothetical protein